MKNEVIELILTDSLAPVSSPERADAQVRKVDPAPGGVVVGTVTELADSGEPLVRFGDSSNAEPVVARSTLMLTRNEIGKEVVLTFEGGDVRKPIIMGILQSANPGGTPESDKREVQLDGESLVFTADREIVLKCGKASITLTRAGKVLIRGAYLLNRSSGVNRIKGGSVQIN